MAPSELVASIRAAPSAPGMVTRVVAVDGHGGAGKSTLAARLADALHAPVVHTDDFASWDDSLGWWPRMIGQVFEPLATGDVARFQRYDWSSRSREEWVEIPPSDCLIVEGVSASRVALQPNRPTA